MKDITALIAKTLGSSTEYVAPVIKAMGVRVDVKRLRSLLRSIANEVESSEVHGCEEKG